MTRKKILIFGISTSIGANLANFLKSDYQVVGTYSKTRIEIDGILSLGCDLTYSHTVQSIILSTLPDIIIYCSGHSSVEECSSDHDKANFFNSDVLSRICEYSHYLNIKICYISSMFVFAGENKTYVEMDIPEPNTIAGKSYYTGESFLQKNYNNYIIFRTGKIYNRSINVLKPGLLDILQRNLFIKNPTDCDNKVSMGYLDVNYLSMIIKLCIEKNATNRLFQVSSNDIMSTYEFALAYCEQFNEDKSIINSRNQKFPLINNNNRSLYFHLDISNIERFLNIKLPSINESLKFTFDRLR